MVYSNYFTIKGIEHRILFSTCKCEPIAVSLVRARLWPATPRNPHYAFSFDLLDWAIALLLECQVSLKDLCQALYYKCPYLVIKVHVLSISKCCSSCLMHSRGVMCMTPLLTLLKNTGNHTL